MPLTVGSLFSGIGGIDLGLERAGMVTRWFCEYDPHCQNVLARHWPGVPIYGDITGIDWTGVEGVDLLAGGFPCQPVSIAGDRKAQEDDRWLWPEFARAIRGLRPRYVLVENVRNLLAVNGGSAFAEILGDLAALGYDTEWDCLPAVAIGAPHRRDRLWVVANRSELRRTVADADDRGSFDSISAGRNASRDGGSPVGDTTVPHAFLSGLEGYERSLVALEDYRRQNSDPTGSGWWAAEPSLGRVAHGFPHRLERLRSLGNAVVPQVVEFIGRRIVALDEGATG